MRVADFRAFGVFGEFQGARPATWVFLICAIAFPMAAPADEADTAVDEVIVTGSHIPRDTFTSSSPISVLDSASIGAVGATNPADFLARLPSVVGDSTTSSTNVNVPQTTGINTIALRNLGASRTLVLLNGRRYVSGTSAGAGYGVDLNSIPLSIVDRIEVLSGGQSAAYGSDAVAGVVNIITKNRFEGTEIHSQIGQSAQSDRRREDVNVTVGRNFGDRSNVWLSLGYSDDEGLMARDRDFSRVFVDAVDTNADGILDSLRYVGSSHTPGARVGAFNGDGTPFTRTPDPSTSDAFNFSDFRSTLIPVRRTMVASGITFELASRTRATLEANYARVETRGRFEPIPLDVRNDIFKVSRGGSTGINFDPAAGPVHPLFDGTPLQSALLGAGFRNLDEVTGGTFRRLVEFGDRGSANARDTFRVAAAIDHDFGGGLQLNTYATYGITTQVQKDLGDINLERARHALNIERDGAGNLRCADPIARIAGCVPFNPFNVGDPNADPLGVGISRAAVNYLAAQVGLEGSVEQIVVSSVLSGNMPFILPMTRERMSFAAGVEYREEKGEETPDPLRQKGIARGFQLFPTQGSFDVVDVFAEVHAPLLPRLSIDLAARVGDYSSVGRAGTWKVGLDAPLNDWLRLRAAKSTAVRAPNVSDLFAGGTATAAFVFDPCDGTTATTSGNVAVNCRSIAAIQNRINAQGAFILTQVEKQNTSGILAGSPDVAEETADSVTVGFIVTPPALDALSLAVDYYDITIDDAIALTDRTVILNRCYGVSPSAFDPGCGGLVRRDLTTGAALDVNSAANNENGIETRGVDVELRYVANLAAGRLTLGATANFLDKYRIIGMESGDVQRLEGEVLLPKIRGNLNAGYAVGRFDFNWQVRYRDRTRDRNVAPNFSGDLNEVKSALYNDVRVMFQASDGLRIYVGANNVLDEEPPILASNQKYQEQGTMSNGTAFDLTGRQWYLGVNFLF